MAPAPATLADYVDTQTALMAVVVSLVVLYPPKISYKLVGSLGALYAALQMATAFGLAADATAFKFVNLLELGTSERLRVGDYVDNLHFNSGGQFKICRAMLRQLRLREAETRRPDLQGSTHRTCIR